MSNPALGIAETVHTASIKRDPSPAHDINPATTADERRPLERTPSEVPSIPSDVVDPSRVIRPISRRRNLPPLPDLRFEQSYLASLRGAESWGRIAWITIRDQVRRVCSFGFRANEFIHSQWFEKSQTDTTSASPIGPSPSHPRHALDPGSLGLATLEPRRPAQWQDAREQAAQVVV